MTKTNDNRVSCDCWVEWTGKKAVANAGVALVNYDKEILILKRRKCPTRNYWELPSGGMDRGEEPQDAAMRELGEETNIKFDIKQLEEIITVTAQNPHKTDIVVTFLAYPIRKQAIRLREEHSDFCWLPLQKHNTTNYPMNNATRKQIKAAYTQVFQGKRTQPR